MIDNELQPSKNFILYTTPNGEVKLEVFPFWKQFKKKFNINTLGTTRKIRAVHQILYL